jgi:hypothetical protein
MVRGTAPEYTRLNEKTDIWAIGAAIWYLIANRILTGPHQEFHFPDDMPQNLPISAENRGRLDAPGVNPFGAIILAIYCNDAGKTRDPNSVWSHVRGIWECVGEP